MSAEGALERRKQEGASSVLALEVLARILPDHTHLTELQFDGPKIRLVGLTADAPALIGLLERSGLFAHASFFAPTTKAPSGTGEPLGST